MVVEGDWHSSDGDRIADADWKAQNYPALNVKNLKTDFIGTS